jgi:hypothetical protein
LGIAEETVKAIHMSLAAILVAACTSSPTRQEAGAVDYALVYALGGETYLFQGARYDKATFSSAVASGTPADHVLILVLRDAGQGLTVPDMLVVIPALSAGKRCLYLQNSRDKKYPIRAVTNQDVDQSFCPTTEEIEKHVGPYSPPPQ